MVPIVTADEMRAIDAAAPVATDVLVERAGAAVARAARRMLGGTYGRAVVVIAGPGANGADGRVAARLLAAAGVHVRVVTPTTCPADLTGVHPRPDLVIDAAYGTGCRGTWHPPVVGDIDVLAVDLPSGIDAQTGRAEGAVLAARRTVTFAALKPGLVLEPGRSLAGVIDVADIGLDVHASAHLVERADVRAWTPPRPTDAHKWRAALRVVAGAPSMAGAARFVSGAAMRSGVGIVHLSTPGSVLDDVPDEVVQVPIAAHGWATSVVDSLARFHALAIGPGLGRDDATASAVRQVVLEAPVPVVVDGDGLFALAWHSEGAGGVLRHRTAPTVLTPHDGEFGLLTGAPPGADRFTAARRLAADLSAVVLLKGSTTLIARPDGAVLVVDSGDARLATAGSGDVLTGIIGALLARGVDAFHAAAAGAFVHGRAGAHTPLPGAVAGDLVAALAPTWAEVVGS